MKRPRAFTVIELLAVMGIVSVLLALLIPSLFLVDHTGVVRWAHSDPDFKVRPSTAQILAAIDATKLASR